MTKRPTLRIVARDGVASAAELQGDCDAVLLEQRAHGLAGSTKDAIDWLIKNQDPEYFAEWLAKRSAQERRQIADYLDCLEKKK